MPHHMWLERLQYRSQVKPITGSFLETLSFVDVVLYHINRHMCKNIIYANNDRSDLRNENRFSHTVSVLHSLHVASSSHMYVYIKYTSSIYVKTLFWVVVASKYSLIVWGG